MDFREIRRLTELMKTLKNFQDLKKTLDKIKDIKLQQEAIRNFIKEHPAEFGKDKEAPSKQDLEILREKAGYDREMWSAIVRELLGEPPPVN